MNIAAEYDLTRDEIRRALTSRGYVRFVLLCFTVLAVGVVGTILADGVLRGLAIADLFIALTRLTLLPVATVKAVDSSFRLIGGRTKILLTPETARIGVPLSVAEWSWDAFVTIRTTTGFWLFKPARAMSILIPRRALTPADAAELDAFIAARAEARTGIPA